MDRWLDWLCISASSTKAYQILGIAARKVKVQSIDFTKILLFEILNQVSIILDLGTICHPPMWEVRGKDTARYNRDRNPQYARQFYCIVSGLVWMKAHNKFRRQDGINRIFCWRDWPRFLDRWTVFGTTFLLFLFGWRIRQRPTNDEILFLHSRASPKRQHIW